MGAASTILLKNKNGALPLSGGLRTIALIGDDAGPVSTRLTYTHRRFLSLIYPTFPNPFRSPPEVPTPRTRSAPLAALRPEAATVSSLREEDQAQPRSRT